MKRLIFLACLMFPSLVAAHHGRDFLMVQDYYLPGLYDGVLITNMEYSQSGTDYEFGIEPEILIGVLPRVALGVSVGFTDQTGMNWAYESVTPAIHIQLSPPDSNFPIRFAISAGYEFAREYENQRIVTSTSSSNSGSGSRTKSSRPTSSNRSSRPANSSTSSSNGGGIAHAVSALLGGSPELTSGSAPAPSSEPMVGAAPADYGSGSTTATATTTTSSCPDLGPDAPPCPDPSGTGGGTSGGGNSGAGDGHDHSHNGAGHTDTSGASHSHSSNDKHDHTDGTHSHTNDEEDSGHDHGKGNGHHNHEGTIHVHGQDAFIGRFIMETDLGDNDKLVVNLINVLPDDGTAAWGYAAGLRHTLTHAVSVSVEAMGDFSADGYHEISLGAFVIPNHHVTLRAGAGMGLTPASPDWSIRGGVVWRF